MNLPQQYPWQDTGYRICGFRQMPILWPRYMLYSSFTIFLDIYGLPTLAHIFSWRLKCERNVFTAVRLEKNRWIHGARKNYFAIKLNQFLLHVSCSHLYLSIILVQLVVVLNGHNSESLFITSKIYSSLSLHQTVSMVTPQGKLHVKMIRYSGKFFKENHWQGVMINFEGQASADFYQCWLPTGKS